MTPVSEATPVVKAASVKLTERINRIEPSATMAVVAEADKLRQQGIDVVDFGAGEPHFATPQHVKDAAIAAIQNNFSKYTAVGGTIELRDAIVNRHATDFASAYKREETMASTGGKHVLFNAIQVLVDHGDEVILPVPYWVSFKDIVRYAGGNCVLLETDEKQGFRVTAQMIERLVTPRTKLIILNSPSNPSGAVMSPEDLTEVVTMAAQRGIWVISDECYVYLNYTGKQFSVGSLNEYCDWMVIVGSLSKTYAMTGWRLGYALAPAKLIAAMQKLQSQSTSNPTSIVQKAAVAALNGPQQCVEEMRLEYVKLRDHVVKGLRSIPGVNCTLPEGAFYAYPNVSSFFGKSGVNSPADLAGKLLREAHVALVPGEGFGTHEHVRVSYATSIGELDRGLERMRKFLAAL
ncbi:MAG: L-aspartate aminotransferase apoenzyme [Acidobacteriaceae bacterium]|jgi:aspartate aminotransferase|nr:L-aspartate aminotransferase apoenzyme [Acidobacteriaceae bacterium]